MSAKSDIEWTDATWTPIRARVKPDALEIARVKGYASLFPILEALKPGKVGPHCEHVSPGCEHCYSETNNARCLPANGTGLPFDRRSRDLVELFVDGDILTQPWHWRKPRCVFVCSQTDLFAEFVTDEMIDCVFAMMARCSRHTFQVLTKRADRMREYLSRFRHSGSTDGFITRDGCLASDSPTGVPIFNPARWPLPNVWLGVSLEDQPRADERPRQLLRTPAALRFLSVEPLLGPVDVYQYLGGARNPIGPAYGGRGIDWVIVGGESGPGARPMHPDWARSIRDQCVAAGVPFFFKQWGEWHPLSRTDGVHELPFGKYLTELRDGKPAFGFLRKGKSAGALLDGCEWKQMPEIRL